MVNYYNEVIIRIFCINKWTDDRKLFRKIEINFGDNLPRQEITAQWTIQEEVIYRFCN